MKTCDVKTVGTVSVEEHRPDCSHLKRVVNEKRTITEHMILQATYEVCVFRDPGHAHHPGFDSCAYNREIVKLVVATLGLSDD